MTRLSLLNSPLFLGFEQFERTVDRLSKASADGYPPYNIEQVGDAGFRVTLAVAGFGLDDLAVSIEDNQLVVRGRTKDEKDRVFLHRGIAARQFHRTFVLADGIEVTGATLDNGLLMIDLQRPLATAKVKTVEISRPSKPDGHGPTIDVSPRSEDTSSQG